MMEEKKSIKLEKDSNSNVFFKYSKNRPFYINLLLCLACFIGLFIFSGLFNRILKPFIGNEIIRNVLSDVLFCATLFMFYYRDLKYEFKLYFSKFGSNFVDSLKYYFAGFGGMVFFNIIIIILLGQTSANETGVRELLFSKPFTTMISISLIAPFSEELIFRKSLQPLIKNKWIYAIICGLLFGLAHLLVNFMSGSFVLTDLIYVLPYACLGGSFALMDRENNTVFSSIVIHAMHNTLTALLLLASYLGGYIK